MSTNLPRGLRNNNPLNIRINPANNWQGKVKDNTDGQFEQFTSMSFGIRAAFKIIHNWLREGRPFIETPSDIICRWAPPSENNTTLYIDKVEYIAKLNMKARIKWTDKDRIVRLVHAMAIVECGAAYKDQLSIETFSKCYDLA